MHGLRHSHKTWMAEDGIPEILAEQRLGHEVPGMRGLYAHASQRMRDELMAALQNRGDESLRHRPALPRPAARRLARRSPGSKGAFHHGILSKLISQILPDMTKAPSSEEDEACLMRF